MSGNVGPDRPSRLPGEAHHARVRAAGDERGAGLDDGGHDRRLDRASGRSGATSPSMAVAPPASTTTGPRAAQRPARRRWPAAPSRLLSAVDAHPSGHPSSSAQARGRPVRARPRAAGRRDRRRAGRWWAVGSSVVQAGRHEPAVGQLARPADPRPATARSGARSGAAATAGTTATPISTQGREQDAVERPLVGRGAADDRADDLAHRQEHRVQPHDRAAIVRECLADVRQQAQRRGRRARQHEQAGRRERSRRRCAARSPRLWLWLMSSAPTTSSHAAADAVQDDRGPAHVREPVAPVPEAREEDRRPARPGPRR